MKLGTLCYIKENGKTLMLNRIKNLEDQHYGKYNGLGGKMEHGETPEECIKREVFEESGLVVFDLELKGILTFPAFDDVEDWYVFVFIATQYEGKLKDNHEGYLEWINDEDLLNLPLWDGDRLFLKWLEKEEFFSGKLVYKAGKLVDYDVTFY